MEERKIIPPKYQDSSKYMLGYAHAMENDGFINSFSSDEIKNIILGLEALIQDNTEKQSIMKDTYISKEIEQRNIELSRLRLKIRTVYRAEIDKMKDKNMEYDEARKTKVDNRIP